MHEPANDFKCLPPVTYGTDWIAAALFIGALTMPTLMWLRRIDGKLAPVGAPL